jgi:hypothetical protein
VIRALPFRPFKIHMMDGLALPFRHPDFSLRSPSRRMGFALRNEDEFRILDRLLMKEFEFGADRAKQALRFGQG